MVVAETWYYSAGVIARRRKGKLSFLVMKTMKLVGESTGEEIWQFAGGMEELEDNGNPVKTLNRELRQETGLSLRKSRRDEPILLHREIRRDGHIRYFYLVWKTQCEGILRTETIDDNRTRLYPPEWKSYEFVRGNICRSQRVLVDKLGELKD